MVNSVSIWSLGFWRATLERAIKTAAQAALLQIGGESIQVNALTFNLPEIGGFALGGAVTSVLMSLGVNAITKTGPSVGDAEHINKPLPSITRPDSEADA